MREWIQSCDDTLQFKMIVTKSVVCSAILLSFNLKATFGHGYLDEPVGRSTAGHKKEYYGRVPLNTEHMGLNCGGGLVS